MDTKKIKKSETTLTSLVVYFLLTAGIFFGLFIFMNNQATDAGVAIDSQYSTTYAEINSSISTLDNDIQTIKTNVNNIAEAEDTSQVAWNGLKGIGNVLLLPLSFLDSATGLYESIFKSVWIIPSWVKVLLGIGVAALVIFLLLGVLTGGNPKL